MDGAAAAAERRPLRSGIQFAAGIEIVVKDIHAGMGDNQPESARKA